MAQFNLFGWSLSRSAPGADNPPAPQPPGTPTTPPSPPPPSDGTAPNAPNPNRATGATARQNLANLSLQTGKAMTALLLVAAAGFLLILALGLAQESWPARFYFLTWAAIAAACALLAGGALGLLFGLPTATGTTVITTAPAPPPPSGGNPNPPPNPAGQAAGAVPPTRPQEAAATAVVAAPIVSPPIQDGTVDIGYRDSTSLEQIADWLTKIIVGLTLTQYDTWEDKFEQLSTNLTEALLGRPPGGGAAGTAASVPGGVLLALYFIIGFIVSYLWMRRFFILEMVTARREAREAMDLRGVENQRLQAESFVETAKRDEERRKLELNVLEAFIQAARSKGLAPETDAPATREQKVPPSAPQLQQVVNMASQQFEAGSPGAIALTQVAQALPGLGVDPQDPWRGKFGRAASANGVTLDGTVTPTANPNVFKVNLLVRAATPDKINSLAGTKAIYFLHYTFGLEPRVSTFDPDGNAPLELYAWGAFTVGVALADGTTLELDLAALPGAPHFFRIR